MSSGIRPKNIGESRVLIGCIRYRKPCGKRYGKEVEKSALGANGSLTMVAGDGASTNASEEHAHNYVSVPFRLDGHHDEIRERFLKAHLPRSNRKVILRSAPRFYVRGRDVIVKAELEKKRNH